MLCLAQAKFLKKCIFISWHESKCIKNQDWLKSHDHLLSYHNPQHAAACDVAQSDPSLPDIHTNESPKKKRRRKKKTIRA